MYLMLIVYAPRPPRNAFDGSHPLQGIYLMVQDHPLKNQLTLDLMVAPSPP